MRRVTGAVAAALLSAGLLLGACGAYQEPAQEPAIEAPEAPDVPDCDAEDRRKNEVPDCGFKHQGKFYAWSWVKAGKKTPPHGWRAKTEQASAVAGLSPKKPVAAPATVNPPPVVAPVQPKQTASKRVTVTRKTSTTGRTSTARITQRR